MKAFYSFGWFYSSSCLALDPFLTWLQFLTLVGLDCVSPQVWRPCPMFSRSHLCSRFPLICGKQTAGIHDSWWTAGCVPPPYPCNLPLSVSSSPSRINTNTFCPASAPSVFHCFNAFYFSLLTTLLSHHSHYLSRRIFKSLQAEHVCLTQVTVTWTEGYYNNYNTKSNQSNKVILISLLLFF